MASTLSIPNDIDRRLADLAAFAGCDKVDVIRRLLDSLVANRETPGPAVVARALRWSEPAALNARAPRERGAQVELGGEVIRVDSVRDLYEHVLRHIVKNGKRDVVRALLPYKTSSQRYLIADRPVHPNRKQFFVPVEHSGLFMETHKSYQTAVSQLEEFLAKVGITFRYLP